MSAFPKSPAHKPADNKDGFFSLTLGRKKKQKEVSDLEQEGRDAIDGGAAPIDYDPSNFHLEENEERSMIDKTSLEEPKVKELIKILTDWVNNELVEQRIIVKDIQEDLFDGQVLQKLLEKLGGIKLQVPEVTQTDQGQKDKLQAVLNKVNEQLELQNWDELKWSVDSIHSKNLIAILHLLVALATHYRAPIRLPEKVNLKVVVVTKREGKLEHKLISEEVTSTMEEMTGGKFERDAFDTLFDHAPDKLSIVKRSLIEFANRHLEKVNLTVTDLDTQFADGVYLILLMGLLEGYFVPLYSFSLTPEIFEDKVHNIQFAFELMQDAGLPKPKARPEDVANCELKSTLRVLYNLFTKYKRM
uniref:Beta-parvin n=1 Tax=Phallusia mammillata TaxID=59560 RepID=A0A6F9DNQ6_9ASCI|nr:beta-parvin [Phallusia mammillata]